MGVSTSMNNSFPHFALQAKRRLVDMEETHVMDFTGSFVILSKIREIVLILQRKLCSAGSAAGSQRGDVLYEP